MKWRDLARELHARFPAADAAAWDNAGFQIGAPEARVRRVLVALDLSSATLDQAVALRADGVVAHHPLIFQPLKAVRTDRYPEKLVAGCLKRGVNFMALHTNLDVAPAGPSFEIARRLGLGALAPLQATRRRERYKIVTFVPAEALERVRDALAAAGAGTIGAYSKCAFFAPGEGHFVAGPEARPAVGRRDAPTTCPEYRLEMQVDAGQLDRALTFLRKAHPYEEPVAEAYRIEPNEALRGWGALGRLAEPAPLDAVAARLLQALDAPEFRLVRAADPVRTVAVVSGAGASLMDAAVAAGADLLVTGDLKYHEAQKARESGLSVIDAGHFHTEKIVRATLAGAIREICGDEVEVAIADERDPFESCGRRRPGASQSPASAAPGDTPARGTRRAAKAGKHGPIGR